MSVHVIAGGTIAHVRPHLAIAAPAYGGTGRRVAELCAAHAAARGMAVQLHLTRMAGGGSVAPETNADVAALVDRLVADPGTRMIFLPAALCDFEGAVLEGGVATPSGVDRQRLVSSAGAVDLRLVPAQKVIGRIRERRKDVFLVAWKTTAGATPDAQYLAGLGLLKRAHANLVLANDVHTRHNVVVAPELARYGEGTDRAAALGEVVAMAFARMGLTFTRTEVVPGELVPWTSDEVPSSLRRVVDHCVARGAYLPFRDVTVGHFGWRPSAGSLVSSRRRRDFNHLADRDLVRVDFGGDRRVVAHGALPSAGARSQYEVLSRHPELDCIVHFHCPAKEGADLSVRSQRELECGSHECGRNTADGLRCHGPHLAAVMLDRHGPNVVFSREIDPEVVIRFIEEHFDLSQRSDGLRAAP
jgi:hypothetical protein